MIASDTVEDQRGHVLGVCRGAGGRASFGLVGCVLLILLGCAPSPNIRNIRRAGGAGGTDDRLTFMTFNIRVGGGVKDRRTEPYFLSSSEEDLARVAEAIRSVDPDVVALQEVRGAGQAKWLAERLDLNYVYMSHGNTLFEWGLAVLSKLPITSARRAPINTGIDKRAALLCSIDITGRSVTFVNVHYHIGNFGEQVKATAKILERTAKPLVLMGDLNRHSWDDVLRPIHSALVDTCSAVDTDGSKLACSEGTFLYGRNNRIDYILVDHASFEVRDVGLVPKNHWQASDHIGYFSKVKPKE